jgi:hypothetical protein
MNFQMFQTLHVMTQIVTLLITCLKKVSHDFSLQPPVITLPCFSIKGVVGKYIFMLSFLLGKP